MQQVINVPHFAVYLDDAIKTYKYLKQGLY